MRRPFLAKVIEACGSDAPSREAQLKVVPSYQGDDFIAFWDEGFCGCRDCNCLEGYGTSPEEAIADYWEQWEERHGEENG